MKNLIYITEETTERAEIVGEILAYITITIFLVALISFLIICIYSAKKCNEKRDELIKTLTAEEKAKILEWHRLDRFYLPKRRKK